MSEQEVSFRSPRGRLTYQDSRDHFENGLLRLLRLDRDAFIAWLAAAEAEAEAEAETDGGAATDSLAALGRAFQRLRAGGAPAPADGPLPPTSVENGPDGSSGVLWHPAIAESPGFGVARASDGSVGWLVRPHAGRWLREREPPAYDEAYFEGDASRAGGYGDYAAQSAWRLEKSARQVRELQALTGVARGARALDIGSGYGFFRRALQDAGIEHVGLEISGHARAVAHRLYGFESLEGTLHERRAAWAGRFDLITLWDMLEHVADPVGLLRDVAACLRPGGVAAIKTPNLDCPEADLFGPHYHSLKREHLVYFAPGGLRSAAASAGLELIHASSTSHLLKGFVGTETTARWAAALRGADLLVYLRAPLRGSSPGI